MECLDIGQGVAYRLRSKIYYNKIVKRHMKQRLKNVPKEMSAMAVKKVWSKYFDVDPKWAQCYFSINHVASPLYVPTDIWFTVICRRLNRIPFFRYQSLQDKNYLDTIFGDSVLCPGVLFRNINGELLDRSFNPIHPEKVIEICKGYQEVVVKPSLESKHARNISFVTQSGSLEQFVSELQKVMDYMKADYVVQTVLKQHKDMARLNPDSINTIRVLSLLWKGEVHILGALVRIGTKGARVDNPAASNGVSCVLTMDGKMTKFAYDRDWNPHTELPNGIILEGYQVPCFECLIETVKRLHYKVPHSRIIGWDTTISENGKPRLIEANLDYPEIYFHQLGDGPVFKDKDLFDEILSYVTKK